MMKFDEHIFQMGWNHQLVMDVCLFAFDVCRQKEKQLNSFVNNKTFQQKECRTLIFWGELFDFSSGAMSSLS